jgi:hypothetical protein
MRCSSCGSENRVDRPSQAVLVKETGARGFEPHVYLERAKLARLNGDEAAHRLFLEVGAPIRAAEVARELES